jgi:hypothetical protein
VPKAGAVPKAGDIGGATGTVAVTTNTLGSDVKVPDVAAAAPEAATLTKVGDIGAATGSTSGTAVQTGGSRTPRNKTLSKYKNKYNVLNF